MEMRNTSTMEMRSKAEAPRRQRIRLLSVWASAFSILCLAGCAITIPADPQGTLERVHDGELRVGVSPEPGLVDTSGKVPTGPLPELVEDFATDIDADSKWTVASEETLVAKLEDDEIDLAIGGFTEKTPWIEQAGKTRGYSAIPGADGRKLVMLVPLGENAFLTELETFLDEEAKP